MATTGDSAAEVGELRHRQVTANEHVNSDSDDGSEDVVTSSKPRKTYGRTKDGTSKHMK